MTEALAEAIQIGQIATKVHIESLRNEIERAKSDIIKWVAGLFIAQGAVIAALGSSCSDPRHFWNWTQSA